MTSRKTVPSAFALAAAFSACSIGLLSGCTPSGPPAGMGGPQGPLPVQNMGAEAVLFCFAFLYMAARGAGVWGLDARASRPQQFTERRDRAA